VDNTNNYHTKIDWQICLGEARRLLNGTRDSKERARLRSAIRTFNLFIRKGVPFLCSDGGSYAEGGLYAKPGVLR